MTDSFGFCCLTADALVSTGLSKLGYTYVNIGTVESFLLSVLHIFSFWLSIMSQATDEILNFLSCKDDCWAEIARDVKV